MGESDQAVHRIEDLKWEPWLRDPSGYTIVLTSPLPGNEPKGAIRE
jgi:hypothetical protein